MITGKMCRGTDVAVLGLMANSFVTVMLDLFVQPTWAGRRSVGLSRNAGFKGDNRGRATQHVPKDRGWRNDLQMRKMAAS